MLDYKYLIYDTYRKKAASIQEAAFLLLNQLPA